MWVAWLVVVAVVVVAVVWWFGAEQTALRNRWLDELHGAQSGSLGVGLSLLVVDARSEEEYAELLGREYGLLEVVALLDGARHAELLGCLVERYHLIQVEYHPSGEFAVWGVVGLYRSRKRRFRRFVVVDCRASGFQQRLQVAADVASLEYLLPLGLGEGLRPGAVARIVTELSLHPLLAIDQICLAPRMRPVVWRRVAVATRGGFDLRPWSVAPRPRRVVVWLSPLRSRRGSRRAFWLDLLLLVVWLLPMTVWGVQGRWLPLLAWLLAGVTVACCRLRIRQLDGGEQGE
ncbi:MAG: hypothetical protein Q4A18_06810 [Rikenellaceae bacterium]|nr:hypothetical protein [Rikenellaceae bacterium]